MPKDDMTLITKQISQGWTTKTKIEFIYYLSDNNNN